MATRIVEYGDVKSLVGQELGTSNWHLVTQEEINTFADATHDHHVVFVLYLFTRFDDTYSIIWLAAKQILRAIDR